MPVVAPGAPRNNECKIVEKPIVAGFVEGGEAADFAPDTNDLSRRDNAGTQNYRRLISRNAYRNGTRNELVAERSRLHKGMSSGTRQPVEDPDTCTVVSGVSRIQLARALQHGKTGDGRGVAGA